MSALLEQIEFGSLLSYSPHGHSIVDIKSKAWMYTVKQDQYVQTDGKSMKISDYVAKRVKEDLDTLPFSTLFTDNPVLVPTPSSSLKKPDSLDVPMSITTALGSQLGNQVSECLVRTKPLPKSATSAAANRSTAAQHYESLQVQAILTNPTSILLIDDVVTRGATVLGAASRLAQTYPLARISAFIALRSVSNPSEFKGVWTPIIGQITLQPNGGTLRRP